MSNRSYDMSDRMIVLRMLALGKSHDWIHAQTGVAGTTVRRWKKKYPEYIEQAKKELMDVLAEDVLIAADYMRGVMMNSKESTKERLNAAKGIQYTYVRNKQAEAQNRVAEAVVGTLTAKQLETRREELLSRLLLPDPNVIEGEWEEEEDPEEEED